MKIATWNVNSVNSRKPQLLTWLSKEKPDVVLLQETKCVDTGFPREEIEELGYNVALCGQKTYNGVAVLSLLKIDESVQTFKGNPVPDEARYLEAVISIPGGVVRVASVYVPNGGGADDTRYKIKLKFLDALCGHMADLIKLNELTVIGGDFNVAPEEIDVFDPKAAEGNVLFTPDVRSRFRALLNIGYCSAYRALHPNKRQQFSWWDYRSGDWYQGRGMMLDHLLLSPLACDRLKSAHIDSHLRGEVKPSDHAPVVCELYSSSGIPAA